MNPSKFSRSILRAVLVGGALCIALSLTAAAQVQTTTTTAHGTPTKTITVQRGEIVYVSGNSVVVKMEDGTLRHFDNVPETTTVTVDGKQLNVHQLKPGMKVEKQTITTTTPRMVTTIKTVTGTVWKVNPPLTVILTMENNKNQSFKIPNGQKFNVNGQETDAWGLRKGMKINAQVVTESPEVGVSQHVKRSGEMPPPEPQPDVPILMVVAAAPAPAEEAPAEAAPAKLPKTASELPLVGLLGLLFCGISLTAMAIRGTVARLS